MRATHLLDGQLILIFFIIKDMEYTVPGKNIDNKLDLAPIRGFHCSYMKPEVLLDKERRNLVGDLMKYK